MQPVSKTMHEMLSASCLMNMFIVIVFNDLQYKKIETQVDFSFHVSIFYFNYYLIRSAERTNSSSFLINLFEITFNRTDKTGR